MSTNKKAEAIYQLNEARKSGIEDTYMDDAHLFIFYKNGVTTINDGCTITVQFEHDGYFYSVDIR